MNVVDVNKTEQGQPIEREGNEANSCQTNLLWRPKEQRSLRNGWALKRQKRRRAGIEETIVSGDNLVCRNQRISLSLSLWFVHGSPFASDLNLNNQSRDILVLRCLILVQLDIYL